MSDEAALEICPPERLNQALVIVEEDGHAGLAALEGLLAEYPDDPQLHFLGGSVLAGLGRFDEAQVALAMAVEIAPDFEIARFQLGLMRLTSGNLDGAMTTWAPLQALADDHPLRLFSEGLLQMADDAFVAAGEKIRAGLARNHENPVLNRDMQMVLDAMAQQTAEAATSEEMSEAHLLLQQFAPKSTRH